MSAHPTETDPAAPANLLQRAVALQITGRLVEAEQIYVSLLGTDFPPFDALYGLGIIRLQQNNFQDGVELFRRAITTNTKSAEAHHYLGFGLTGLKQTEAAIQAFEKALAIRPAFPEAHNNLGHALQAAGRVKEAIRHFRRAVKLNPNYAEAHNNLGNALHLLGQSAGSLVHYHDALALRPDYAEAHWNLANALKTVGRCDEAIAEFRNSLQIRPDYAEAFNGIGNTLQVLGRYDEAIEAYRDALAIDPAYSEPILNICDILVSRNQHHKAINHYNRLLERSPHNIQALVRRGIAYSALKLYNNSIVDFEEALAIEPDNVAAFNGLATSAIHACDWKRTKILHSEIERWVAKGNMIEPFTVLGYSSDASLHLACAKIYASRTAAVAAPRKIAAWRNEKIRIGYVAAGFHHHPTAYLSAELLEIHDRSRFEIIGISLGPDDGSDIRARIIRGVDQFIDVSSKTDQEITGLVRDMQIDILVDRSGYTTNSRPGLFARRPAPLQVNYIGFPGTLGAKWYDYVIADPIVLPFDQQAYYTEKIVHLPFSYQSNDSRRAIAKETPSRYEVGLPRNGFVFCCFNNVYKITQPVFEIWMRLLRRVEGSVLWLLGGNDSATRNLRNQAAARGIDPDRLIFAAHVKLDLHLARHRLADLFLDTLPYNAHTTASDALWAGLPVVTCLGNCFPGRVAASLLAAIGLPELIAANFNDYEAMALNLATDQNRLQEVREKLVQNRRNYPLFDTQRYRHHIERAYRTMWQAWQDGETPRSFHVEP
jgi:protein O-GlcNAc transferase